MLKALWVKYLILLLAVLVVSLSAALVLRKLMIKDFHDYLEAETEDRAYWVAAALEGTFERNAGWDRERIIEDTVWALMLGFAVRVYDADGSLLMDTDQAVGTLPSLVSRRIAAISEQRAAGDEGRYIPYALFLGGVEIGKVEMKPLRLKREEIFIERSDRFLLLALLVLGGAALLLSIVFSRRLTRPLNELTEGVSAVSTGDLTKRVTPVGNDEIRRLSDAFNRMAQTLEKQETLRKRITANIAHELRTPLSAIRGELEGMMDGFIPNDREHLQSLCDELGRFRKLIEGIEELAEAEASSLHLVIREFDLAPFLKSIVERYRKISLQEGITIELICAEGLMVKGDPDRLNQVIVNLLSNAIRATKSGGHIRVSASGKGSAIIIEVSDDGRGIKTEDLPHIFERFYKAGDGGLGLGLAIVRELVDAHGGTIAATSEYGRGSSFTVTLPQ